MRRLPPAFVIATAIELGLCIALAVTYADAVRWAPRFLYAVRGTSLAVNGLLLVGIIELGRGRLGARLTIASLVVVIAANVVYVVIEPFTHAGDLSRTVLDWTYIVVDLLYVIGLAMCAGRRGVALAVGSLALLTIRIAKAPLIAALGQSHTLTLLKLVDAVRVVIELALAMRACEDVSLPADPMKAAVGIRRVGHALVGRLAATLLVPCLLVAFPLDNSRADLGNAWLAAYLLDAAATLWLAVGVLAMARALVPELGRYVLLCAGGLALWCTGVQFARVPRIYAVVHDLGSTGYLDPLTGVVPIFVVVVFVAVAAMIWRFANSREDRTLDVQAIAKTLAFVLLMAASLAVQFGALDVLPLATPYWIKVVLMAVWGVWGTLLAVKLCWSTARVLAALAPPAARVVSR